MFSACSSKEKDTATSQNTNQENVLIFNLDEHDEGFMEKSDGWTNGSMFDCTWRGDNVYFSDGIMTLKIDQDGENSSPKWSGAEYRTKDFYHYGKYEVSMKPIKNDGVVSSFFTYTGPSDNNPWDEIDIEFLGKDTTQVQFNYFTNGVGSHEYLYDLGFDASEEFHVYGFEWLEDSIIWYVDGVAVHTATEDIPTTPAKIMMNVWPGIGVDSWLNAFDGQVPLQAEYDWFQYTE
jgi:beta-glucanase (GH16 family)